jgi:hypothetical protein
MAPVAATHGMPLTSRVLVQLLRWLDPDAGSDVLASVEPVTSSA